ncbi:MAG: site-specific DNA-methyltransferase [Planctomycetaceae bacterium]|jgi:DNA modification methylase|nr:site-specific DNA-methyltransferase [Planctomycetaceae bacterium]
MSNKFLKNKHLKNANFINRIINADALKILPQLEENSIDIVLTDPPYFLDKLDNHWDYQKVSNQKNQHTVKSLPAGMKFDTEQGKRFYQWYYNAAEKILRVMKPGGFFFSFSSPRLYHRMACAIDDAGFELRDVFMWLYTKNQPKAMSIEHFIRRMNVSEETKDKLVQKMKGWKTPQIKSCFEPIAMAQKPAAGTYLQNMMEYETGLLNTDIRIGDNMYPANVFTVDNINEIIDKTFLLPKPQKKEKESYNDHKTVKPLAVCEYLIKLSAFSPEAVILDPFAGSGTTAVAAKKLGLNYIGIELNEKYARIAEARLDDVGETPGGLHPPLF